MRGVAYIISMIVIISLVSFFSAFGRLEVTKILDTYFIDPASPLPLSFPFYAHVYLYQPPLPPDLPHGFFGRIITKTYSLTVLGLQIDTISLSVYHLIDAILYYSFFLLINIIGAIIGYRISKASFVEKLFKRRKNIEATR